MVISDEVGSDDVDTIHPVHVLHIAVDDGCGEGIVEAVAEVLVDHVKQAAGLYEKEQQGSEKTKDVVQLSYVNRNS